MKIKLQEKRIEAKGTKSFFWKPEGTIRWLPGQYYYFTLPNLIFEDKRGATRHFTISSSPTEGNLIRLTTRIRDESGFKKSLDELAIGTVIGGEGPTGTFVLDEKEKGPHILLAGGIGVTPFRSALKYFADKKINIPVYLVYACSMPEEIVFRKELEELGKNNPNFKVVFTVSKPEESKEKWTGKKGRIDEIMLKELLKDWGLEKNAAQWWICGPPPMIDAMEEVLGKMKINSDNIRSEKFTGY